jgi:hypothetical protein
VAVADPPHALVLWQVTASGKAIDPAGPWGDDYAAWSWAFVLEPLDATGTRLLVRMLVSYRPVAKWARFMWLLVEPAHFVMGAASSSVSGSEPKPPPVTTSSARASLRRQGRRRWRCDLPAVT